MGFNKNIKKGMFDSIPILISFTFVFSSLGALYYEKGLTLLGTTLGTILMFAAPLQIATVDLFLRDQLLPAMILTALVNSRFFFMSIVAAQYFKGVARSLVLLSLMMFSASTYVVTLAHLKSSKLRSGKSQFLYYLGVSVPSYLVAIIATMMGFWLASYIDYMDVKFFVSMILPIHFTSLAAKSSDKGVTLLATLSGGVAAPFLNGFGNEWLMVWLPVLIGIILAGLETTRGSKE